MVFRNNYFKAGVKFILHVFRVRCIILKEAFIVVLLSVFLKLWLIFTLPSMIMFQQSWKKRQNCNPQVHRNLLRKFLFLRKLLQYSIKSLIWGKICWIFENTSSGTAIKSAFHEFIGIFWEWIGKRFFKYPSDVWMNGFRKLVGNFPAVF